ncbi:MAG: DHH family phosphoesterase, partial [Solobacterium sp.]|nr:DHH family phosphoesterase [Solobacterium sp.]
MKPYYVTGHKNPDCDSIASAIAYAALKTALGEEAVACAQGKANRETMFLLNRYGFEHPQIIHSAKCTLSEIEKDEAVLVGAGITMKAALDQILSRKNKGVFVTEGNGRLIGIVSMSDLTRLWIQNEDEMRTLMSQASLSNIERVLDAKAYNREKDFHTNGVVHIMPSMSDRSEIYRDAVVVLRNNPDVQRFAIDSHAACIIISGEDWVDNVTLERARENHVSILHTPHTVIECSRLIYQAPSIDTVLTRNVISFRENETVDVVSSRMANTRFRTYPVLNDKGQVTAAISRYHLFHYEKKRFILVDHNEVSQSVNDLEYGEVCEIVDHHRLGGIETVNPINIIARTVGST